MVQRQKGESASQKLKPQDCDHSTLLKVDQPDLNATDSDVLLYTCSACRRLFTITDV